MIAFQPLVESAYHANTGLAVSSSRPAILRVDEVRTHRVAHEGHFTGYIVAGATVRCPGRIGGPCSPESVFLVIRSFAPERRVENEPELELRGAGREVTPREIYLAEVTGSRFRRNDRGEPFQYETVMAALDTDDFLALAQADTVRGRLDRTPLHSLVEDREGWRALADSISTWRESWERDRSRSASAALPGRREQ